MKVFVYKDISISFHSDILERCAWIRNHFMSVEGRIHQCFLASGVSTEDPEEADLFYVPFYFSCLLHCFTWPDAEPDWSVPPDPEGLRRGERLLQDAFAQTMEIVMSKHPYWRRRNGRDHIFVFGQARGPTTGNIWSRWKSLIGESIFLGVESRPQALLLGAGAKDDSFNVRKDIVIPGFQTDLRFREERFLTQSFEKDIFLSFRGTVWNQPWVKYRARQRLREKLAGEPGVVFSETKHRDKELYWKELKRSIFSLCPAGITPWTLRFYESILAGSIPVVLSDDFVFPFQGEINYSKFVVRIREKDAGSVLAILRAIPERKAEAMRQELKAHRGCFLYNVPPLPGDAFSRILGKLEKFRSLAKKGNYGVWVPLKKILAGGRSHA
jgi:hypothetical protein